MTSNSRRPTTSLCRYTETEVYYRNKALVKDLLSSESDFVGVMTGHILGRDVSASELRVINAILISIMEHGMTPSAIATRSTYMSSPECLQGAVAAGLLGVGSQFIGTIENCAAILKALVEMDVSTRGERAAKIVAEHKGKNIRIPGFGHHLHRPDDPRALRLLEIGSEQGFERGYIECLKILASEVDRVAGKHITINATGAIAALLGELDVPVELMRGFAVISRAAGLVAHIGEELERPSGRYIWQVVDEAIPYSHD